MNEQTNQDYKTPKWVRLLATSLFGWLVLLFSAFLIIIGISALFKAAGVNVAFGSSLFIAEVVITALVSAVVCYYIARKSYKWFSRMRPATLYVVLVVLLFIAVFSFPAPYMFTEMSSG